MRRWSQLEPWEWEAELVKVNPGLRVHHLVADALDVPELQAQIRAQTTFEGRARVALRYFGDEGNCQPVERIDKGAFGGRTPDWGRLPPLAEGDAEPRLASHGNRRAPGRIPRDIVERALLLHERDRYGRRRLSAAIPGLTPYTAGQILGWYKIGKPGGIWLDEDDRLKWSKAISTTRDGMLLPRI